MYFIHQSVRNWLALRSVRDDLFIPVSKIWALDLLKPPPPHPFCSLPPPSSLESGHASSLRLSSAAMFGKINLCDWKRSGAESDRVWSAVKEWQCVHLRLFSSLVVDGESRARAHTHTLFLSLRDRGQECLCVALTQETTRMWRVGVIWEACMPVQPQGNTPHIVPYVNNTHISKTWTVRIICYMKHTLSHMLGCDVGCFHTWSPGQVRARLTPNSS